MLLLDTAGGEICTSGGEFYTSGGFFTKERLRPEGKRYPYNLLVQKYGAI